MSRSMTALGRSVISHRYGRFSFTLRSLNRKFLEIHFSIPPEFSPFEIDLRKQIASQIHRGQISLHCDASFSEEAPSTVTFNRPLIEKMLASWQTLEKELNLSPNTGGFWTLLAPQPHLYTVEKSLSDNPEISSLVKQGVELALEDLLTMKEFEGSLLKQDLLLNIQKIKKAVSLMREEAPRISQKLQQKILTQVREWSLPGEDNSWIREIALIAEKCDINEELVRLDSHCEQFLSLLEEKEEPVGDKLEFLTQEMHREWTTIGAKAPDINTTNTLLDAKVTIKRMREQIQNIE